MALFRWLRDQPYLLLSLTSLFWAGNAVVGRAVVERIPPVALAEIRWAIAFLLLLPFAWRQVRADLTIVRRHIGMIILLSLTGIGAFNMLLYSSLKYTTAINATLMQSSGPLLIGLWNLLLFRDPPTRWQIAGVCISLAGIAVIVSGGDPARLGNLALNVGDVIVIVAIAIYALYSTLLRKRPGMAPLSFVTVTIGFGALMLLPPTIIEQALGARFAPLNFGSLAAIVYVAVFPSILAYLCFNRGVQLIGANRAGPFFHLIPLFGALLAVTFLGERPGIYHGVGAALIVGGVLLASRRPAPIGNRVARGGADR
jgi:drug/metabolite transporter (DMT)-like permease